jgi:hypothetical protein
VSNASSVILRRGNEKNIFKKISDVRSLGTRQIEMKDYDLESTLELFYFDL